MKEIRTSLDPMDNVKGQTSFALAKSRLMYTISSSFAVARVVLRCCELLCRGKGWPSPR